jgi:hypothetical protein
MTGARNLIVSHRARWDLDLLTADVAERCFDQLDALAGYAFSVEPLPLAGELAALAYFDGPGFRIIVRRGDHDGLEIVHIASS